MTLYPPNIVLFVIAGCLAIVGVLAALPLDLQVLGLVPENAAWFIFLGWFLLAIATVLPHAAARARTH